MDEYPSNSRTVAAKAAPAAEPVVDKKIEPVAKAGEAKLRKKPLGRRLLDNLTGDDGRTVFQHVVWDVVVPMARDMIVGAGEEALHRAFYGSDARGPRRGGYSGGRPTLAGNVNYNAASGNARYQPANQRTAPVQKTRTTVGSMDYRDIVLPTRVMAEETIDKMHELIQRFRQVTVADLFDIVGITGEWTDDGFGWTDLTSSRVERVRDGYILNLPRLEQL
jgi:hypothetical protein